MAGKITITVKMSKNEYASLIFLTNASGRGEVETINRTIRQQALQDSQYMSNVEYDHAWSVAYNKAQARFDELDSAQP